MFWYLPKIQTGKRAILALVLPEGIFLQKNLNWKKSFKWLNFNISYNEKALLLTPVLGAPALALALELLKQMEIEEIIALGWVGKISKKLNIGDFFLPKKAYSLEGTSKIYQKSKRCFFPENEFLKKFKNLLKQEGINFKEGSLLSTDAPWVLERSFNFFKKWLNKVEAMDMETSAFFAVCKTLGLKGVALHLVSDEVGKISKKEASNILCEKRKKLIGLWESFLNQEV